MESYSDQVCLLFNSWCYLTHSLTLLPITFRLPLLSTVPDTRLRDELQAGDGLQLDEVVVASIADLSQYMGITSKSSVEEIAYLCSEFVAGWCLCITHCSEQIWRRYALVFSHAFCLGSIEPIETRDQEKLKMGFLLGVSLGYAALSVFHAMPSANSVDSLKDYGGKDKDLVTQASHQKKLHAKAVSVGMSEPARLLCNDLDGAKMQLMMQQKRYERRFRTTRSQLLLQDAVEVEDDADDDDIECMSLFEFNEDGMVL